jgi:hypothetical protein
MTLEIHVLTWDRHTDVVRLNQLMRSQPSFFIGCIVIQRPLLANRTYLLNQRALYICDVSIVRFYKSDLLVNTYFGGFMKIKRKKVLLCFILFLNFVIDCEHITVS